VDYQPGGSSDAADPIADVAGCKRDVAEFQRLGINTVRVYTVDNTADHDECMGMLAQAGIYLALDVNTPKYSLNRNDPGPSYNADYLQSLFATIDAFASYDNTVRISTPQPPQSHQRREWTLTVKHVASVLLRQRSHQRR